MTHHRASASAGAAHVPARILGGRIVLCWDMFDRNARLSRFVPLLVLAFALLVMLAGWLLFPPLQRVIAFQDCAAAGRTDCALLTQGDSQRP